MLGNVLRMEDNISAKQAMLFYFRDEKVARGIAGRPRMTLLIMINKELRSNMKAAKKPGRKKSNIKEFLRQLDSLNDLKELMIVKKVANERKKWAKTIEDAHALLQSKSEKVK